MLKHEFHSDKADKADTTRLRPRNWNAEHVWDGGNLADEIARNTRVANGASLFPPTRLCIVRYGGAQGGGADDTLPIQGTIDRVNALGGGTVWFPRGDWLCENYTGGTGDTSLALYSPGSNIRFACEPGARLIGGGVSTESGGFIGLGQLGGFSYDHATTYPIAAAAAGDTEVFTSTFSHASHFVAGDVILFIGAAGLETREQNIVISGNTSNGKIILKYALGKNFAQGTQTVSNVTALTSTNIEFDGLQILTARQCFVGQQIIGLTFRNLKVDGVNDTFQSNLFQLNHIRRLVTAYNDFGYFTHGSNSGGIAAGRSSSDIIIHGNRVCCNSVAVDLGEGPTNCSVTLNEFYCNDIYGATAINLGGARKTIIGNNLVEFSTTSASVPAIYDSNGALSERTIISGNIVKMKGSGNYAIKAEGRGTIVANNNIETVNNGIWVIGRDVNAHGNEIYVTVGGGVGIVVESTIHSHRLINNTVINLGTKGGTAILVTDGGAQTESPTIALNKIDNFTNGIVFSSLAHDPGTIIFGNQITNTTNHYSPTGLSGCVSMVLPIYANNAAAVGGGQPVGSFYRTNADPDVICVVH